VDRGADEVSDTRNNIVFEPVEGYPLPAVQLVSVEANVVFVIAEVAAVEEEQQLVALALVRCPVHRVESVGEPVEAEFLGNLTAAAAAGDSPRSTYPPRISQVFL